MGRTTHRYYMTGGRGEGGTKSTDCNINHYRMSRYHSYLNLFLEIEKTDTHHLRVAFETRNW